MKLTKKYLQLLLLGLLPCAIFASQSMSSHTASVSQFNTIPLSSLPHSSNIVADSSTVPISHMDDIAHSSHANFSHWLKASQVKQIINKAQQNGDLSYVTTKLQSMRLPKSLALIPIIESHYKTGAISNKGASGIWQLMPATAKRFGLNNSQRYQLAASTDAALHYFKTLHQKFGNWEFAIAAYNAGEGRIQQALAKNPNAVSVQQLKLPTETKQYVQKFYMLEDYVTNNNSTTA